MQFHLIRSRNGEKVKTLREMIDLTVRAAHEQELFPPADWELIQWLADTPKDRRDGARATNAIAIAATLPATIGRIYHTIDPAILRPAPLQRGEDPLA